MAESGTIAALPCNTCKREARFLTPYGLKCPEHALETAIYGGGAFEDGWLPIRIRPPSGSLGPSNEDESAD